MKKLLLLFVVIAAVLVSSCSKDEPEVKDEPTIVGKWGYQFEDWFIYTFTYEFKSDGTGTSHMHRTGEEGDPEFEVTYDIAYSINGDKLTLTVFALEDDPNGEDQTIVVTIVRLTEEEIVFEGENEDGEIERVTWNRLK